MTDFHADHLRHVRPKQAVILVGGRGTRLGSLAAATPKPLMPIADERVFLDYLIDHVARHGVADILLLAGHMGDQIEARYHGVQRLGATIRVSKEPEPAGTAGALVHAVPLLEDQFFLLNGDGYLDFNLLRLSEQPLRQGAARLALRHVDDAARYGLVSLADHQIVSFNEKSASGGGGLINGGVYWMTRDLLDLITALPCSLEQDIFPVLAAKGLLEGLVVDGYFIDIGLPQSLEQARVEIPPLQCRPAVIFDRDGTLTIDEGYTHQPSQLEWIRGAREAVRAFNDAGWYVLVATNQAGVARGLYEEADVHRFHDAMQAQLAEVGAHIDAFYHCPFHPDAVVERYRHHSHPDRKPNPGMIERALRDWPIDKSRSVMVGDRQSDVAAANAAGLKGVLFDTDDLTQALVAAGVSEMEIAG